MRKVVFLSVVGVAAALGAALSCSASNGSNVFGQGGAPFGATTTVAHASSSSGTTTATTATTSSTGMFGFDAGMTTGSGMMQSNCKAGLNEDKDKDGWTIAEGDCNDCDPNVNPGAIDVLPKLDPDGGPPVFVDSNCDGKFDPPAPCDDGIDVQSDDPYDGARAVELCQKLTDPRKWGIKSATWVMPDGSPQNPSPNYQLGHGILSAFGPNVHVQAGKRMLGLSSGTARQPSDPGYQDVGGFDKGFTSPSPFGFPKESPACPGVITGDCHDGVALELELVAPTNAHGFTFNFAFFTYEWPDFICSEFNDFFVALLMPFPMGQADGNISFDSMGNPVSVNNAFLQVCGCSPLSPPCMAGGKTFPCALGDSQLIKTGFGQDTAGSDHGSTYWLGTTAPVTPHQSFTIRWATYDSGDGILDTTGIVDNWQWLADPGTVVTVTTTPLPQPK